MQFEGDMEHETPATHGFFKKKYIVSKNSYTHMAKILFVYPNFSDPFSPNLGITNLLTYINQRTRHKAMLLDLTLYKKSWKEIVLRYLQAHSFNLIGFTFTLPTMKVTLEIARFCKTHFPSLKTIFGGVYASILKEKIFEYPEVDYCCVGEGEIALHQLLDQLDTNPKEINVQGIYFRAEDNTIIKNQCAPIVENLEDLPFNNYDYWNPKLLFKFIDHLPMMASRGCPYRCTFCTQFAMHELYDNFTKNGYYRIRSPHHVCDEIDYQMKKYEKIKYIKGIIFNDDTFTSNRKWVEEFCKEYIKRGFHKKYHWAINARIDNLDKKYLLMLKQAGCYYIYFGVETVSKRTQMVYTKAFNKEKIIELTEFMKKIGIKIRVYYIIDGPYETYEDNLESFKMIREMKPETFQIMPFIPIPNTKASEIYKQSNPSQFREIVDLFNLKNNQDLSKSYVYTSPLITAGIGHMMSNNFNLFAIFLKGFFSSHQKNRFFSIIVFSTAVNYFKKSIIYGKLRFFLDLFKFLKNLIQYQIGVSDLFGMTLKKYICEQSFH